MYLIIFLSNLKTFIFVLCVCVCMVFVLFKFMLVIKINFRDLFVSLVDLQFWVFELLFMLTTLFL